MKTNLLLKNIIDVLFILMIPGFLAFIFIIPFGVFNTRIGDVSVQSWQDVTQLPFIYWLGISCGMLTYFSMLIAVFYLKRTARHFLDNNLLKYQVSNNLKRSGFYFLVTAAGSIISYICLWWARSDIQEATLSYNTDLFYPFILTIIGLFFIIISNTLEKARATKEEFDLTV